MSKEGKNGISENTPKSIQFGAGTIHKGLKYTAGESGGTGSWNYSSTLVGATSGGSKITITPEITTLEVDGAWVKVKGLDVKTGETAKLEINFIELSKDIIKAAAFAQNGTSEDSDYDLLEGKSAIEEGDYWENVAFVGKNLEGKNIIAILDNALCTSGLDFSTANKDAAKPVLTFESYADLDSDLDVLPWRIYYPKTI